KPKLGRIDTEVKKLAVFAYLTGELIEDQPSGMGSYLMRVFQDELSYKVDDGIINGLGAGQLKGILKSECLVTQTKEGGQQAAAAVGPNIAKMLGRLWVGSHATACWFVNPEVIPQLCVMSIANTQLFTQAGAVGADGSIGLMLGKSVVPIEQCSALGTVGDII